jgi:hypothetical protein
MFSGRTFFSIALDKEGRCVVFPKDLKWGWERCLRHTVFFLFIFTGGTRDQASPEEGKWPWVLKPMAILFL